MSEVEAGRRLAQVVSDPTLNKSGVYWSWDNDKSSLWFDGVEGALENRCVVGQGVHSRGVCICMYRGQQSMRAWRKGVDAPPGVPHMGVEAQHSAAEEEKKGAEPIMRGYYLRNRRFAMPYCA